MTLQNTFWRGIEMFLVKPDSVSFDLSRPKHPLRFRSGFVVGTHQWFGIKALFLPELSSSKTGKVKSLSIHVLYVNFGCAL